MDTGQPGLAPENVAVEEAAQAFKAHITGQSDVPRDEQGRFASRAQPEESEGAEDGTEIEAEGAAEESAEHEAETDDGAEVGDEASSEEEDQPEPVRMPASWKGEDAELWLSLPPGAQAKIAEREGQRDAAVNVKFQEAANARKAAEAQVAEANANRDQYDQALNMVMSLIQPQRPPAAMLNPNSDQYDPETYHLLRAQAEEHERLAQHFQQEQQRIAAQREQEEAERFARFEELHRPKLLEIVPDLADPAKASSLIAEIRDYAVEAGLDPELLPKASSVEVGLVWKAMEYDRIKAASERVKAAKPQPRKSAPAVKAGAVTTRQAVQKASLAKAHERLAKSGAVEDAAAIFKHAFKG